MYILALDQGTSSSRAILFNLKGAIIALEQKEFTQIYPQNGWVEHNPLEILTTQIEVAKNIFKNNNIDVQSVIGIGIANQRETTVLWNKKTGQPYHNAIVWQDKRTANYCNELKGAYSNLIQSKTGLLIDSYFSASKINWLINNVEGIEKAIEDNEVAFGTIDTWLLWNLTNGRVHATDTSNASRTLLFNINTLEWDDALLDLFAVPKSILPEVKNSADNYGETNFIDGTTMLPIYALVGDQQAALIGHNCWEKIGRAHV